MLYVTTICQNILLSKLTCFEAPGQSAFYLFLSIVTKFSKFTIYPYENERPSANAITVPTRTLLAGLSEAAP